MHRAFVDSLRPDLDGQTLKRFKRVLRLKPGELVELFDGTGRVLRGTLGEDKLENTQILHIEPQGPVIKLYQALVSMDKLEQITQHSTELGVSEIILFKSERRQVDFKDKIKAKLERLTKIAQDASRQSGRADVPKILWEKSPLTPLFQRGEMLLLTTPHTQNFLPSFAKGGSGGISVLIGPEGGFSPAEIERFNSLGAQEISLGPYILRTETASLAALAQIQGSLH